MIRRMNSVDRRNNFLKKLFTLFRNSAQTIAKRPRSLLTALTVFLVALLAKFTDVFQIKTENQRTQDEK